MWLKISEFSGPLADNAQKGILDHKMNVDNVEEDEEEDLKKT